MTDHTLVTELDELHAFYVAAVNNAVDADNLRLAERLGRQYDTEATEMVARHEGLTHLLPLRRQSRGNAGGAARRRIGRLGRRLDDHTLRAFNAPASRSWRGSY